ncbi:hypothetical protein ABZ847_00830 [Streptomyces bauhiniae]
MVTDPKDSKQQTLLDRYREAAAEFQNGNLPPRMSGHWFLKHNQAIAERTWTDVGVVLAWMSKHYAENPPFVRPDGSPAYISLEVHLDYAADVLPLGIDVSWVHYMPSRHMFSVSIVCCPNRHHPELTCPLPPL